VESVANKTATNFTAQPSGNQDYEVNHR